LFEGTQLRWGDVDASTDPADHQFAVEYDHTYTGGMPAAGTCNNRLNTAWFTGDDAETPLDSATATVRICTPAVIVSPPSPPKQRPPAVLPNTGGPNSWILAAGLALLLAGGSLVLTDRRRRRRS
jgi:LPXTG-motif cell wall-anchored protein